MIEHLRWKQGAYMMWKMSIQILVNTDKKQSNHAQ